MIRALVEMTGRRRTAAWLAWLALLAGFVGACRAGSITLLGSTRIDPDRPLTLADVAGLEGEDAESLAGVVVAAAFDDLPAESGEWRRLDVESVRRRLEESGTINWGRLELRGSRVLLAPERLGPVVRRATASEPGASVSAPRPAAPGVPTLRDHIGLELAAMLSVAPADLRLTFEERDAELLSTPVVGRLVEIRPTGIAERMPLSLAVYAGDRTVARGVARVRVLVRRDVLAAGRTIDRGEAISAEAVSAQRRWLPPDASPAPADRVVGHEAKRRIDPGDLIESGHTVEPLAAERGDVVSVRALSRGLSIQTKGRATRDARLGEVIELELIPNGSPVMARITERGRAVVVVEPDPVAPPAGTDDPDGGLADEPADETGGAA